MAKSRNEINFDPNRRDDQHARHGVNHPYRFATDELILSKRSSNIIKWTVKQFY